MKHLIFGVVLNWAIVSSIAFFVFFGAATFLSLRMEKTIHPEKLAWRTNEVCIVNTDFQRMSEIVAWCREDNSSIMIILEE